MSISSSAAGVAVSEPARVDEAALCADLLPRLRLYSRRHLRDAAAADDLAQEVLLTVLEAVRDGRVHDPSKVGRYALGVARNLVRDGYRTKQRRERVTATRIAPVLLPATQPELHDLYRVLSCIGALTKRARAVISMSFLEDLNTSEIASSLTMSVGSVRVTRHRAIAAVRDCLSGGTQ